MKTVLPWVIIVILLGGVYFLYSANKEKEAELAKQSLDLQDLDKLRADSEELKKLSGQAEELTRLRKDNEDNLRLRSETQRLRDQNKQLTAQLAAAQAQGAQAQQAQEKLNALANENQALRGQSQKLQQTQAMEIAGKQMTVCIGNLAKIQAAKVAWAQKNQKTDADVPTAADLAPFLGDSQIVCPAGGTYSINAVNTAPTCSVPGHALPAQ